MSAIDIAITLLPHAGAITLPQRQTLGAAGVDLQAALAEPITLAAGCSALISTGLAIALPVGYEAQVRPRSGLALHHQITVLNAPGTIDADYRGEIGVILINHGHTDFIVEPLMRIAQMVIVAVPAFRWRLVDALDDTARGAGGFGHTGAR